MSSKSFTPATPRYRVEGVKGEYFDVFSKRANAIKAAIKMATEYRGTTFVVVKKVNLKDKVIFRFKIEADYQFDDLQDVYRSIIEVYQKKLDKTKYWRKPDDS
jgi:hypothetical protein